MDNIDNKTLNKLEADRDIVMNIIDDHADKWDIEEAIGLCKTMLYQLNNKRAFPEKVVKVYK